MKNRLTLDPSVPVQTIGTDVTLRLSTRGWLQRCAWASGMGFSLLAGSAAAAPFGSAQYFQSRGVTAANPGAPVPTSRVDPVTGVTVATPQQALIRANRSIANLSRAAEALASAQAAQSAARQLALSAPANPVTDVPNGLAPGGLQVAASAINQLSTCAATNTCAWQNANLPVQTSTGAQTTVTVQQTAKKAILSWDSFNIGRETTLNFDQRAGTQADGSNDWIALNRVGANASPSRILGQIKADGSVYLINPNGVIFGGSSQVNVHSLMVSSLPLYLTARQTTLRPGDDPVYLAESNRLFLETGLNSTSTGTANGNILGLNSGQNVQLSTLGALPGDIRIDAGASIATTALGYSLIAAPNVSNAGTVSAVEGQVIVAAGVGVGLRDGATGSLQLKPVLSGQVSDGSADVTPSGQIVNSGLIQSRRGDLSLLARNIDQQGVLIATTSATRAGSLNLSALDRQALDSDISRSGTLRLSGDSVTALLPDANGETTTSSSAADRVFQAGTASLRGGAITLDRGALIEAPGQNVQLAALVGAISDGTLPMPGRVYLEDGSIIDVSGLADVQLAMAVNLISINRLGLNELADSPLQRLGVLFGAPITVDSRVTGTRDDGTSYVGTPVANVGGFVDARPRGISELLQNGGTLTLAGAEVVTRAGSSQNLDGGYLHYLGGIIETTRLLAANGAVIDIADADPNLQYIGIAGRFDDEHPRWNVTNTYTNPLIASVGARYESDYLKGGNAGTLNVFASHAAVLDGDISAQAYTGRHQVADARMPSGGHFNAGAGAGNALIDSVDSGRSYVITDVAPDLGTLIPGFDATTALPVSTSAASDTGNLQNWIAIPGAELAAAGFSTINIAADTPSGQGFGGEIVVADALRVQPGGSISLTGSRVTVLADLTATAGSISVTATGNTDIAGSSLRPEGTAVTPISGDVVIGDGVQLSTRGQWINDALKGEDAIAGGAFVNGGSISLGTLQASLLQGAGSAACPETACFVDNTGSVLLGSGSLLDVSSGGRVLPSGALAKSNGIVRGRGGSIALETYRLSGNEQFGTTNGLELPTTATLPSAGRIVFGGELLAYGFSGGGSLSLRALGFHIGNSDANQGPAKAWDTVLPADFFTGQGFGSYRLIAEYDATITAGSVLKPQQFNFIPDEAALLAAQTGIDLYDPAYTRIGALDDFHRQATNFELYAGDYLNWRGAGTPAPLPDYSAAGVTGTVLLDRDAAILADARATVTLGSNHQVTVLGNIVAHGGAITLTADTASGGYAQVPGRIDFPYIDGSKSVFLGASSLLDASGTTLLDPFQQPIVAADGSLTTPRTGSVLAGGSVTLSNDTGYVIALGADGQPNGSHGARIDVSGSAAVLDLRSDTSGTGYLASTVASDAGSIRLGAGAGLYFDGRLLAQPGNGTLLAQPGGSGARGGSLSIATLLPTAKVTALTAAGQSYAGATRLVLREKPIELPAGALTPGMTVEADLPAPSGVLYFGVDRLDGSGIDSLLLGVDPSLNNVSTPRSIVFANNLSLNLGRSIIANASNFVGQSGADGLSSVSLNAPYVALHGYANTGDYGNTTSLPAPVPGVQLTINAANIDLGGQFNLRGFGDARFNATGDIRLLTPAQFDFYRNVTANPGAATAVPGALFSAGNLTFQAAQLYPATGNSFIISAVGAEGFVDGISTGLADTTIRFLGNEASATAATPLSAGGSLLVNATLIEQSGTLRAPGGQIQLGVADPFDPAALALFSFPASNSKGDPITAQVPLVATRSVRLASGSITSVSLDGLIVPYGRTVDGLNYSYNAAANTDFAGQLVAPVLSAPPEKRLAISAAAVTLDSGATVNLAGGGDLQAAEFVAGTGGSRDVLSRVNTSYASGTAQALPLYADGRAIYAIIPGYAGAAAYDPALVAGNPLIGQQVYLSGIGSGIDGLAAGVYTLLPGQYAAVPGAFRVVQDTRALDSLATENSRLADGTLLVAGRYVDQYSGAQDSRSTAFFVQSMDTWRQYSEYSFTSANKFFTDAAARNGKATPRRPVDAGQLVLAATQTLSLGATLNTAAGIGADGVSGAGGLVDIASQRLQVSATGGVALEGYVQLVAGDLSALGASSLLIGGSRSHSDEGDRIAVLADSVIIDNSSEALSAPEIIVVAGVGTSDTVNAGIVVADGATVRASGSLPAASAVGLLIGSAADGDLPAVSGDGALLRLSNAGAVTVTRSNVGRAPVGTLSIGAGARLSADLAAATTTATGSVTLDSSGRTLVDADARFSAAAIDANAGLVSFLGDGAVLPDTDTGFVVGSGTLAQFAASRQVTLRSRGAINFIGNVSAALDGGLALSAGSFSSDGGTVALKATSLSFSNDLGATVPAAVSGSGLLKLSADEIVFGAGSKSLNGFASVDATANQGVRLQGVGNFDFGSAPVNLATPLLIAETGADNRLATTGALNLSGIAGATALTAAPVGGSGSLVGGSVSIDTALQALGGKLDVQATSGDLLIGSNARLSVRGAAKTIIDVTTYAQAGTLNLSADTGGVQVANGAQLDFGAADDGRNRGGDAGALNIDAAGIVQLDGTLRGNASAGFLGGSFSLDSGSAVALDTLASGLANSGVDRTITVRSRSGNLELGAGSSLRAASVSLTADGGTGSLDSSNGNVRITGTIDASGDKGGDIRLFGRSGVDVEGRLIATGSRSDKRGGTVAIGTSGSGDGTLNAAYGYQNVSAASSGTITLGSGALIDLRGGTSGGLSNGALSLRAPLLSDGDVGINVLPAAQILGARDISLEAYATWSTTDAGTGTRHFDGIIDAAGDYSPTGAFLFATQPRNSDHSGFYVDTLQAYVQAPGFSFEPRFAGLSNIVVRPGIELVNPNAAVNGGDIQIASNWNLAAGTVDSNGKLNLAYRYKGQVAPALTLRAAGDLDVFASLSDGFFQYNNPVDIDGSGPDNSASPDSTFGNPLPMSAAALFGVQTAADGSPYFADSSSYRLVAGADVGSVDPLRVAGTAERAAAGIGNLDPSTGTTSAAGSLSLDFHVSGFVPVRNRAGAIVNFANVVEGVMIRTGTGSIDIGTALDVAIRDTTAPGVIYTAGRRSIDDLATPSSAVAYTRGRGLPAVLVNSTTHPEAAGDISINAGRDIRGIQQVGDDEERSGSFRNNLSQYWWPWLQRDCIFTGICTAQAAGSSLNYSNFAQGLLSAGGDITVSAARDIADLSVSAPITTRIDGSGANRSSSMVGGGDIEISAGRDLLSGAYYVGNGSGRLRAGRAIASDLNNSAGAAIATLLAVQDGRFQVSAAGNVAIGGVFNPSYLFSNFDGEAYATDASVSIVSSAGDISFSRTLGEFGYGSGLSLAAAYQYVTVPTLELFAPNGGISVGAGDGMELYPSATGTLSLIAEGRVQLFNPGGTANAFFGLIDAPATLLPTALNPLSALNPANSARLTSLIGNDVNAAFRFHTATPLHAADAEPVRIYSASSDIINGNDVGAGTLLISVDKPALILAGRDIVDLSFIGQNLYASDVTLIRAGRDLYNTPLQPGRSVPFIELGGPGTLALEGGRDIGPLSSANDAATLGLLPPGTLRYPGVRTVGNVNNAYLDRAGANISVSFGIAPGVALDKFATTYLDPAVGHSDSDIADPIGTRSYSAELIAFVQQIDADNAARSGQPVSAESLSPEAAYARFEALPDVQRSQLIQTVLLDILDRTGLDYNKLPRGLADPQTASNSLYAGQYGRGFAAVEMLFPGQSGYTQNDLSGGFNGSLTPIATGNFDLRGTSVQTQRGGDISILGPGGNVLVGSVSAPPLVAATAFSASIGPNNQGLLTLQKGSIDIFTDRSVLLAQSRIFTEQGGDVLIWSSNGDINAGRGARTATEIPPPEFLCDVDHFCLVNAESQVSGAGIAVLQTRPGDPSGTANLVAPTGTVDAGDAGIRVSGSLNVAANAVANAGNISTGGGSTGVPTGAVNVSAVAAGSAVSAAVNQSADGLAGGRPQQTAANQITVEVLGFGGSSGDENDEEERRKRRQ
ncbi:filamentous haemagglutinin family protein [Nevskia sp.]|uniref:filamentous haemagglutinin family protein n=1 Tax=Nevskia sp. TaxID=1929292 RepID=UPI0025ED326C|nr:filamentous haemagglutinin family protein [Nevskia sp.]